MTYRKAPNGDLIVTEPTATALVQTVNFDHPNYGVKPSRDREGRLVVPADQVAELFTTLSHFLAYEIEDGSIDGEFHPIYISLLDHPDAPALALSHLAHSHDEDDRLLVARHPNTFFDTLVTLVSDHYLATPEIAEAVASSPKVTPDNVSTLLSQGHWILYPHLAARDDLFTPDQAAWLRRAGAMAESIDGGVLFIPPEDGYDGQGGNGLQPVELSYIRHYAALPDFDVPPHRLALAFELWRSARAVPSSAFTNIDWTGIADIADPLELLAAVEQAFGATRVEVAFALWAAASGFARSPLHGTEAATLANKYLYRFDGDPFLLLDTVAALSSAVEDPSWANTTPAWT